MFRVIRILFFVLLSFTCLAAVGQTEMCPPRPRFGAIVPDAERLHSQNGVLSVDFTMVNTLGQDGYLHYCYLYADGSEAPTLELNAGDQLILVPDPPGVEQPSVWVHALGGDVVGHLSPDVNRWLAPRMMDGARYGARVRSIGDPGTESWKRLVIAVRKV